MTTTSQAIADIAAMSVLLRSWLTGADNDTVDFGDGQGPVPTRAGFLKAFPDAATRIAAVENAFAALASNAATKAKPYQSYVLALADTALAQDDYALVWNDATDANNRLYIKTAAAGTAGLSPVKDRLDAEVSARTARDKVISDFLTGAGGSRLPVDEVYNLWDYSEAIGTETRYSFGQLLTLRNDTMVIDDITYRRVSASNFYDQLASLLAGYGLARFVAGKKYILSFNVYSRWDKEQFVWMRPLADNGAYGHGAKLIKPHQVTRVWKVVVAKDAYHIDDGADPTVALGSGSGLDPTWLFLGAVDDGAAELFVGAFQLEMLPDSVGKVGIVCATDSKMAGASNLQDLPGSREVTRWLGAALNIDVFGRGVGGETMQSFIDHWAERIRPLKNRCSHVLIDGGHNDLGEVGITLATMQARDAAIEALAAGDGLIPVWTTITPTTDQLAYLEPAKEALRLQMNQWRMRSHKCCRDIASIVADPSNPALIKQLPGWVSGDRTPHYAAAAKRAVGLGIADHPVWSFLPKPRAYQPRLLAA